MTTFTFNKDNWSGEEATIKVYNNGNFVFHDHLFTVSPVSTVKSEGGDSRWDFHTIELSWDGSPWATIHRFECDSEWEFNSSDFSRSHKEPAVLCAIAAANLI
jgi:hypothetical protein